MMTLSWSRFMYEWYLSHGITPLIIDGDDIQNSPETVKMLTRETGLDPDSVIFSWETREAQGQAMKAFTSTIYASTGVVKGKDSTCMDLEANKRKWLEEFGEEWGTEIGRHTDAAMEDYLWLKERKIHV